MPIVEITRGRWEIGPRVGRYKSIPANEDERAALEKIGHMQFDALSVGTESGQVAIIPLDESNRANAELIAQAPEFFRLLRSARCAIAYLSQDIPEPYLPLLKMIDRALRDAGALDTGT